MMRSSQWSCCCALQVLLLLIAIIPHAEGFSSNVAFYHPVTSEVYCFLAATTRRQETTRLWFFGTSSSTPADISDEPDEEEDDERTAMTAHKEYDGLNKNSAVEEEGAPAATTDRRRGQVRQRVRELARRIVVKPISYAAPMPQAIASVLREATLGAVDMAVEEVTSRRNNRRNGKNKHAAAAVTTVDVQEWIDEAFQPMEDSLNEMELALQQAKTSLANAKLQATTAMETMQEAALAQAEAAAATAVAAAAAEEEVLSLYYDTEEDSAAETNVSALAFEDVDYDASEMAPPFLDENSCLVPGEPVVRVEKAPENSRRIFAGIDIMASTDTVWNLLTDYAHLQDVVPNLVVNDVLEEYAGEGSSSLSIDASLREDDQCKSLCQKMKGALLRQVGGAKVAGINFSARCTLEVREWPRGLPDFAHFNDETWEGKSRQQRAKEYSKIPLQRYCFPRPFAVTSLPTRDISMQSLEEDAFGSEFRMYQGVWRMQPLPGCAPPGQQAMRLTYAVEVSPRAYLPVRLIEGRIVRDLCTNLEAIRDFVGSRAAVEA